MNAKSLSPGHLCAYGMAKLTPFPGSVNRSRPAGRPPPWRFRTVDSRAAGAADAPREAPRSVSPTGPAGRPTLQKERHVGSDLGGHGPEFADSAIEPQNRAQRSSAAAASELPPPSPAWDRDPLAQVEFRPARDARALPQHLRRPAARGSSRRWAAQGRRRSCRARPPAAISSRSHRSMAWKTVSSSW